MDNFLQDIDLDDIEYDRGEIYDIDYESDVSMDVLDIE